MNNKIKWNISQTKPRTILEERKEKKTCHAFYYKSVIIRKKKKKKKKQAHRYTFELTAHSKWHCTQSEIRLAVIRSRMNHRPTLQPFHALLIATVKRNTEEKNKKKKEKKKKRKEKSSGQRRMTHMATTLLRCNVISVSTERNDRSESVSIHTVNTMHIAWCNC